REAKQKLAKNEYHMVITDMRMETDTAGYEVVKAARSQAYDPAVALLTAYPLLGSDWKDRGANSMLVKPMNTNDLLRQIETLLISHERSEEHTSELQSRGHLVCRLLLEKKKKKKNTKKI